jgi:hypothetical protein
MRSAGADIAVARPKAFLVDVYETIVTCDFEVLRNELPVIAGAEPRAWNDAFARLVPDLTIGRITMAQGFGQILAASGIRPQPALVSELVRKDRETARRIVALVRRRDSVPPDLVVPRRQGRAGQQLHREHPAAAVRPRRQHAGGRGRPVVGGWLRQAGRLDLPACPGSAPRDRRCRGVHRRSARLLRWRGSRGHDRPADRPRRDIAACTGTRHRSHRLAARSHADGVRPLILQNCQISVCRGLRSHAPRLPPLTADMVRFG